MKRLFVLLILLSAAGAIRARGETTVCTAIVSLPTTISSPGIYCLKQDLAAGIPAGAAVTIAAHRVTIDLNGFRIDGGSAALGTIGISAAGFQGTTIRNGTVRGFDTGISLQGDLHRVEDVRVVGSYRKGIRLQGRHGVIQANHVVGIGGGYPDADGIEVSGLDDRVVDNEVADVWGLALAWNSHAYTLSSSSESLVQGNRAENSNYGLYVDGSDDALVSGNRFQNTQMGIWFVGTSTGKYRDTLTAKVSVPYTGGTDAGNNN